MRVRRASCRRRRANASSGLSRSFANSMSVIRRSAASQVTTVPPWTEASANVGFSSVSTTLRGGRIAAAEVPRDPREICEISERCRDLIRDLLARSIVGGCIRSAMRCGSSMIRAKRDDGIHRALAVDRLRMRLTTLMEILEREIGASPSARSKLALLVAERGQETAARARAIATEPCTNGSRDRSAGTRG